MSYEDLTNLMRREAGRMDGRKKHELDAEITSFDPKSHSVKVKILPEGTQTGWLPLRVMGAGSGASFTIGPSIGDHCTVSFRDGDINTGEVTGFQHNDVDQAPQVQSGEARLKTKSGAEIFVDKNGNISVTGKANVITTVGGVTMKISSDGLDITGGYVKHNGKNIGDTHVHGGIVPGGADTSTPH